MIQVFYIILNNDCFSIISIINKIILIKIETFYVTYVSYNVVLIVAHESALSTS